MQAARITSDHSVMKLAHPQRCAAAWGGNVTWEEVFGPRTWNEIVRSVQDDTVLTPDVIHDLCESGRNPVLSQFVNFTTRDASNTELGGAYATMLYLRQKIKTQPQFLIEDRLLTILQHTDISDDVPMSVLKPPFSRCYIEMGRDRTCVEQIPNLTSGLHILEGAYIEEGESPGRGLGLFITFTGSPLGKTNALDDATDSLFLPLQFPERRIIDVLEEARAESQRISEESNLRSSPQEYASYSFNALKLLVKALLYIGLPETRQTLHKEKSDFARQVEEKKNPAKKAKAAAQLHRLADYILIHAGPDVAGNGGAGTGSGVKQHWRRGHYRMQPHGPQSSLRKVIFMRPQLIGSAQADTVRAPVYKVV